jgi:hypothetical protein
VPLPRERRRGEACDPDQRVVDEAAEDRLRGQAFRDVGRALPRLLVMGRREGARVPFQSLEPQRPKRIGVLRAKHPQIESHRILRTGCNRMDRLEGSSAIAARPHRDRSHVHR